MAEDTFGRVLAGVFTGGLSEAARGLGSALGPDNVFEDLPPELQAQVQAPINEGAFRRPAAGFRGARDRARGRAAEVQGRAPVSLDQSQQEQFRQQQQELAGALQARVAGQGTSVAQQQFQQTQESNLRQAMAQAASARGLGSAGLQQRQLQQGLSAANLGAAGQAATLRAAEQAQAEQTLGGILSGARGQDIGAATAETELGLRGEQVRGGLEAQFRQLELAAAQGDAQAQQALERLKLQQRLGILTGEQGAETAAAGQRTNLLTGLLGGAGSALAGGLG